MQNPVAAAFDRLKAVLHRRPEFGIGEDSTATSVWMGGTQVVSSHANGTQLTTDMPPELGGAGMHVTPGWMFRAGIAACTTTRIAMEAGVQGIELSRLQVTAVSRSDVRGMLPMPDVDGTRVPAGPFEISLHVRIAAPGVSEERLRQLVEAMHPCSPMASAVEKGVPVALTIETDAA